jgi:hypothetical protein
MPIKKIKITCFEMLEEGLKFEGFFFFMFSSRKQGNKYVQNILFAPRCVLTNMP